MRYYDANKNPTEQDFAMTSHQNSAAESSCKWVGEKEVSHVSYTFAVLHEKKESPSPFIESFLRVPIVNCLCFYLSKASKTQKWNKKHEKKTFHLKLSQESLHHKCGAVLRSDREEQTLSVARLFILHVLWVEFIVIPSMSTKLSEWMHKKQEKGEIEIKQPSKVISTTAGKKFHFVVFSSQTSATTNYLEEEAHQVARNKINFFVNNLI